MNVSSLPFLKRLFNLNNTQVQKISEAQSTGYQFGRYQTHILICLRIYMYVMVTVNIKSQAKLPLLTCLTDLEDKYFEGKKVLYNHKLVSHLRRHYRYLHSHHCNMNKVRISWASRRHSCPNTRK